MRAYVYHNSQLSLANIPCRQLKGTEVIVNLKVAGLNRRDLSIPNRVTQSDNPLILGSDGAGVISEIGESVTKFSVGDEVIINPSLNWYENTQAPPKDFDILGMPDNGTFAEKIVISEEQIELKPENLTWEESGVLGLAGLTGYRALFTQGKLSNNQTVFIPGAGSGVATYLINFAKAKGARVIVTSRSKEKQEQALKLGADVAIDSSADWVELLKDEVIDLVIESIGQATFNKSLSVLKPGGRIVVFGATAGDVVDINLRDFFYGQYTLKGSTMGSRSEFREMIEYINKHSIKPVVDSIYPLEEINKAFDSLKINNQFGKIAVRIKNN